MALRIGQQLGSYEITSLLGKGGMGEVYRARDSKLKRDVAIKILPDEFSEDTDHVSRFQREAEALAAVNHQNIAAIYDLQQSDAIRFIILEFVEGDTLADILKKRGALPLEEALQIAKQICEALEVAHEKGIVHRDLKPGNVKLTPEGKVKVLDFGLAKALEREPTKADLSNSPTLSMAATSAGVILGTAAYMSPEQAKGKKVDQRTDIFAFGCLMYEMLAGRCAFEGDDVSEILARVIEREPDWTRLPAETPASIQRLLRRSLKKNPHQRLSDIRDARIEVDEAGMATEIPDTSANARGGRLAWIMAAVAVLGAALFAIPAVRHLREIPTPTPEMRVEINTPSTPLPLHFALSPDGRYIVFVASGDGPPRLWLRPLDKDNAQPMAGTDGAEYPFWSADSRSIGFIASGKLSRIDIGGGPPQVLANAVTARGGTWNAEGAILFTASAIDPIWRVAASGGAPTAVTKLAPGETSHRFPQFLPDGHHFLFWVQGTPEASGIYLGSLDGGQSKRLTAADTGGAYLRPDWLLFMRQGALVARRLNVTRGELTGDPVTLADFVGYDVNLGGFSVSTDGRIAYRSGNAGRHQLIWCDRTGKVIGLVGEPDTNGLGSPELSPDERRVGIDRTVQGNRDVWLMDLVRGGMTRFTFDVAIDGFPLWSSDGSRIAFEANRKGSFDIWLKPATSGTEELLVGTVNNEWPDDWSRDGRFLLYYQNSPKTGSDLWAIPMTGDDRTPKVVVNTPFEEPFGQFSPDGLWVAYQTNESGRFEIAVQSFPEPTSKWQVSTSGGTQPRWRKDGKELYFIAPDSKLMAVTVATRGTTFEAGPPTALFQTRITSGGTAAFRAQYAVSRDGRFLLNQQVEESTVPITLLLNWKSPTK